MGDSSRDMVAREETSGLPIHHLVDKSSNRDDLLLRKKRWVELGKGVAVDTSKSRMSASQMAHVPTFMADAILTGRSPQTKRVYQGGGSVSFAEGGISSTIRGSLCIECKGSGSDADLGDICEFLEQSHSRRGQSEGF